MTTPAGWYPDPGGSGQQRYFDGMQWTAHYAPTHGIAAPYAPVYGVGAAPVPPPPQRGGSRTGLKVLAVVGVLVLFGIIASIDTDDRHSTTSSSSSTRPLQPGEPAPSSLVVTPTEVVEPAGPTIAPAGSAVRDGKFEFQILSVSRAQQAGDLSNQFMTETAQGEFVIVTIGVTNIGNEPQSYFGSNQKLIDTAGREYAPNSSVDMWLNGYIGDINPGNSVKVVLAFDVPPGTPAKALELHDSMFSGGVQLATGP